MSVGVHVLCQFGRGVERRFGLLATTPALTLGDGRRVGIDAVVDAGPGVVDLGVTGLENVYTIEIQLDGLSVCAFDRF